MSSLQSEYLRFLAWLNIQDVDVDEIRLANLVLANLDGVTSVGKSSSRRSTLLVQLAQSGLDGSPIILPEGDSSLPATEIPWKRLRRLEVGPFRGFSQSERFDFDKRIVLIYGPNGSGKSSLCEALEHSLLGTVGEAEAKRIDQRAYLSNARVGRFTPPALIASGPDGEDFEVTAVEDHFRFCFVEKNRIDAFSRIASKTPMERSKLIATLFGVEGFDEFVRGFNENLIHIDLVGLKRQELETARIALAADLTLVEEEYSKLESMASEDSVLAESYESGLNFEDLVAKVGASGQPGRINALEDMLENSAPIQIGLSIALIETQLASAQSKHAAKIKVEDELGKRRGELSFKQLFEAVLAIQPDSPDRCPACDTRLAGAQAVARDPYEKARIGLAGLAGLAALEARQEATSTEFELINEELQASLNTVATFIADHSSQGSVLPLDLPALLEEPKGAWWEFLLVSEDGEPAVWDSIRGWASEIEKYDKRVLAVLAERDELRKERSRLQDFRDRVVTQQSKRKEWRESLDKAKGRIAAFEEVNQPLIEAAADEVPQIQKNIRINAAYGSYLAHLKAYRDGLPGMLSADLNVTAMSLYNGFNRDDPSSDQLIELNLPLTGDDQIDVIFSGNPELRLNALQVMSEGHIRCLGLAILIAKNIKLDCPLLVFDDAVNAIDHDHRNGIRRTLFETPSLSSKQIILTCHGEEFIKNIKNSLGVDSVQNECRFYVFLPHGGDNVIRVDTQPSSRNYIISAREKFDRFEFRGVLAELRRSVENINQRTWHWLSKHGQGDLRLKFLAPRKPYEQHDLSMELARKLNSPSFAHTKKAPLLNGLNTLLGGPEWASLNFGTHESEDTEEFDRAVILRVLEALTELDRTLSA